MGRAVDLDMLSAALVVLHRNLKIADALLRLSLVRYSSIFASCFWPRSWFSLDEEDASDMVFRSDTVPILLATIFFHLGLEYRCEIGCEF